MGNFASSFTFMEGKPDCRILMVGVNGAGKTTIMEKLEMGKIVKSTPAKGFEVETAQYKNITLTVLVFVVDSSANLTVISKARDHLKAFLTIPALRGVPVIVVANMQDMNAAMKEAQVKEKLNLEPLCVNRHWYIQLTSASTGEGLQDGVDWVANELENAKETTKK